MSIEKRTAFAPALCGRRDGIEQPNKPWGVGVVTEGESGYRPMDCYAFATQASDCLCHALNERMGRSKDDAIDIVSSTHRAQNRDERRGVR